MQTPMMDEREYTLIVESLDKTKTLLEWGSGTSTTYFSQYAGTVDSIEHNPEWASKVRGMLQAANTTNVALHEVLWNTPRPAGAVTERPMFEDYINYVDVINKKFDVVLIDGRARFWCAEKILPYLKKTSVVFIHDFWAYQDHMLHPTELVMYNKIFDLYTEIASVKDTEQTIIKLKKK